MTSTTTSATAVRTTRGHSDPVAAATTTRKEAGSAIARLGLSSQRRGDRNLKVRVPWLSGTAGGCAWHAGEVTSPRDAVPGYRTIRMAAPQAPVAALADAEAWQAHGDYPQLSFGGPVFGVTRWSGQQEHSTSTR